MIEPVPILSFFSGGGFLDIGFERAGFNVIWANENNQRFVELYKYGYKKWRIATRRGTDLPFIDNRSIEELTPRMITYRCFPDGKPRTFGVVGGPPCPDFSSAGLHAGKDGANGRLVQGFVDLICDLNPTFFVLENVAGLVRFKRHRKHFDDLVEHFTLNGYATVHRVLNALEFGVPQHRERVFLIGFKRSRLNGHLDNASISSSGWFGWPTIVAYKNAATRYSWPTSTDFGKTPRKPREVPARLCVGTYLIPKSMQSRVPNASAFFNPYSRRFLEVAEGDTSQKSFKRLHRYRYSPTACYGNNEVHLHPWEPRRLSLREAMRIQGIPDSYELPEDVPLQSGFKLISNAVPVPLSMHVAKAVSRTLRSLG